MHRSRILNGLGALALAGGLISFASHTADAASHREAPLMTLDPGADISDDGQVIDLRDRTARFRRPTPGSPPS